MGDNIHIFAGRANHESFQDHDKFKYGGEGLYLRREHIVSLFVLKVQFPACRIYGQNLCT